MLYVGYRWLRIPMAMLTGMLAGMQTQSATLGFALDQAGNDLPTVGYTTVYPMAMLVKIVLAPVLLRPADVAGGASPRSRSMGRKISRATSASSRLCTRPAPSGW